MEKDNEYRVKTEVEREIVLDKSFKRTLGVGILLTGTSSIVGVSKSVSLITESFKRGALAGEDLYTLIAAFELAICFMIMIVIVKEKKPFSKILVRGIKIIAYSLIVSSGLFCLIPGFYFPRFVVFSLGEKIYLDGVVLTIGIIVLIFAKLIQYGFEYQKEYDLIV